MCISIWYEWQSNSNASLVNIVHIQRQLKWKRNRIHSKPISIARQLNDILFVYSLCVIVLRISLFISQTQMKWEEKEEKKTHTKKSTSDMNFEVIKSKTEICYLIYSRKVRFDFFLLSMVSNKRKKARWCIRIATCMPSNETRVELISSTNFEQNVNITRLKTLLLLLLL